MSIAVEFDLQAMDPDLGIELLDDFVALGPRWEAFKAAAMELMRGFVDGWHSLG